MRKNHFGDAMRVENNAKINAKIPNIPINPRWQQAIGQ